MMIDTYRSLPRSFYAHSAEEVAPLLLGMYLVRVLGSETLIGEICEVEAYLPEGDEAAHGYGGKNRRNASLFKAPGTLYIHTQRHHTLMDVVTDAAGIPGSVLIRALRPLSGISVMQKNRGKESLAELTSGPAKLCQALAITKEMDGIDITRKGATLYIAKGEHARVARHIVRTERIGISKSRDALLRFTWESS